MQRKVIVNLGNLVLSLSDAMDLASPSLIQHQQRTAFVVWEIGKAAHFTDERLDGSGYPFHCRGDELTTGARILMIADLFTALAEDRPYRKGMSGKEIVRIMKQFSDRGLLDSKIINLLLENLGEIFSCVTEKQVIAREFYMKQFEFLEKR